MKYTLATLSVFVILVLASTLAFGEDITGTLSSWSTSPTGIYQESKILGGSPFPMSANPALNASHHRDILPEQELPASMAANLSSWDTSPTGVSFEHREALGSPFPKAADPALTTGHEQIDRKLSDVDEVWHGQDYTLNPPDSASPFPLAGDPHDRF